MSNSSNKMSVFQLTILTAVNMMGSGIIMLPSKLAQVGALSIVSWLVTAVGSMCLAYVFAKCGMYAKKGGGMGGYAEYSFGKAGNFMANYTYGVSLIFANTAIAISAVGYALGFLNKSLDPIMTCAATIFTLWLATVLNFGGAKYTGRVSSITVWGVITNIVPYLLCMAAIVVIMKAVNHLGSELKTTKFIAFVASIYSLYACYASGFEAMTYGAIVTFFGWTLYGLVSDKFDLDKAEADNKAIEEAAAEAAKQ